MTGFHECILVIPHERELCCDSPSVPLMEILTELDALGLAHVERRDAAAASAQGEFCLIHAEAIQDPNVLATLTPTLRSLPMITALVMSPKSGHDAELVELLTGHVDLCFASEPHPTRAWILNNGEAFDQFVESVERRPLASLALTTLLRLSHGTHVNHAIAAEASTYAMLQGSSEYQDWLDQHRQPRADDDQPFTDEPSTPLPPTEDSAHAVNEDPVLVSRVGSSLMITLNRPHVHNAVSWQLRDAFVSAVDIAINDSSLLTVELRGNGPSFSAGGDLTQFGSEQNPATTYLTRLGAHPGWSVAQISNRTTAYLHGACIGAGIEVPAFADTVIADPDTVFALPEVGMGLIPGAGGTVSIPRRIGRHRALWLGITGEMIAATTAFEWGLVDEIAPIAPAERIA